MLTNSTHDKIENEIREEEFSEEEEEKEIANMITEDFENDERIIKAFTRENMYCSVTKIVRMLLNSSK